MDRLGLRVGCSRFARLALGVPDEEAVNVQPNLPPLIGYQPGYDLLCLGQEHGAPAAPRLPVAGAFDEIRGLTVRKSTILESHLDQPPREYRFHDVAGMYCCAAEWSGRSGKPLKPAIPAMAAA